MSSNPDPTKRWSAAVIVGDTCDDAKPPRIRRVGDFFLFVYSGFYLIFFWFSRLIVLVSLKMRKITTMTLGEKVVVKKSLFRPGYQGALEDCPSWEAEVKWLDGRKLLIDNYIKYVALSHSFRIFFIKFK